MPAPRIALVTARDARAHDLDLAPTASALERRGAVVAIAVWDDPTVAWGGFDLVVVRSPWDYAPQRDRFVVWAEHAGARTRLLNAPDLLRWNTDKRYLRALAAAGVAVIETTWLEPGDRVVWPELDDFVVKPAVSAGARDTARYAGDAAGRDAARAHAGRLLAEGRTVMVQKYQGSVDTRGERALLYFDGRASHAVSKGPLLRRGHEHTHAGPAALELAPVTPTAAERAVADAVLAAIPCGAPPLYARVDVVDGDDGAPRLLELEVTEPALFLAHAPGAVDRFADAIVARL